MKTMSGRRFRGEADRRGRRRTRSAPGCRGRRGSARENRAGLFDAIAIGMPAGGRGRRDGVGSGDESSTDSGAVTSYRSRKIRTPAATFSAPTAFATSASRPWPTIRRVSSGVTGGRPKRRERGMSARVNRLVGVEKRPVEVEDDRRGEPERPGTSPRAGRSCRRSRSRPSGGGRRRPSRAGRRAVDDRREAPAANAGQDVADERRRERDLLGERPAPQGRADQPEPLGEDRAEVDLGARARHRGDQDDASSAPEHADVRREESPRRPGRGRDRRSPARTSPRSCVGEILLATCPRRGRRRAARGVSHFSGDRTVATTRTPRPLRQLDRGRPDPRGRRVDESGLPALRAPSTKRFRYAVNQASGIAAASANDSRAGTGISIPRGTATLSA